MYFIDQVSVFEKLFGFPETVDRVKKFIQIDESSQGMTLKSLANQKMFNAGLFKIVDISSFSHLQPRGGGTFSIVNGKGHESSNISLVNVLSAQSLSENNGATFQAASNFNCLEFPSIYSTTEDGISNYEGDPTQGPHCALACMPALLYRNYYVSQSKICGQNEAEINLLSRTPITIVHGKSIIKQSDLQRLGEFNWEDESAYQVGVHQNCQVMVNIEGKGPVHVTDGKQIAHHVYAAALNFNSCVRHQLTERISNNLLKTEYKLTILSAWENSLLFPDFSGSKKVFLTLLGGGCFRNPDHLIADSIIANEKLIIDSGLDVYLVSFCGLKGNQRENELRSLVERTNGKIIDS